MLFMFRRIMSNSSDENVILISCNTSVSIFKSVDTILSNLHHNQVKDQNMYYELFSLFCHLVMSEMRCQQTRMKV